MSFPRRRLRMSLLPAFAVAISLMFSSCGMDATPTASEDAALTQSAEEQAVISLWGPPAPVAKKARGKKADAEKAVDKKTADALEKIAETAAKAVDTAWGGDGVEDALTYVAEPGVRTINGTIGPAGGVLVITEDVGGAWEDDLIVTFIAPPGAVDEPADITMVVEGYYLSELAITFFPAGLVFVENATLVIQAGADRVDMRPHAAKHTISDGTTTKLKIKPKEDKLDGALITISLPGFSVYSLGGGR